MFNTGHGFILLEQQSNLRIKNQSTFNSKKFLIIGIGINIVSNPIIDTNYEATNIFYESKKKPTSKEIINLLIISYENFFNELDSYNFINFKTKAELMSAL